MLKSWFPLGSQGLEQFQKFMWDSARQAASAAAPRKDKAPR
jgi:hypothetical protein